MQSLRFLERPQGRRTILDPIAYNEDNPNGIAILSDFIDNPTKMVYNLLINPPIILLQREIILSLPFKLMAEL
jgi:hypothetical protein